MKSFIALAVCALFLATACESSSVKPLPNAEAKRSVPAASEEKSVEVLEAPLEAVAEEYAFSEVPADAIGGNAIGGQSAGPTAMASLGAYGGIASRRSTELPPGAQLDAEVLPPAANEHNTEAYDSVPENTFRRVSDAPLSTFSIDVDTASYSNLRRMLNSGIMPPAGAVRIEEMLNYFSYSYPQPDEEQPFATQIEVAAAPWNTKHRLVRIGLQCPALELEKRPTANLVFLIDVSGSMNSPDKLPLVQQSLSMLTEQLQARDRVAIVVYAGAAGLVLPSVTGDQHETILAAIGRLSVGGSTNGAGGIRQAYDVARQNFIKGAANRVVLATDGDFNVGVTSQSELVDLIEREAKDGVFLSVLGFGTGNYKDSTLEKLADKGNGNYAYIDTLGEARKALVEQLAGTLITVAKDVKIQIEFNPALVAAYRLIGYENRLLKKEDFNDDRKDAGEVGAGHAVTALYELTPVGEALDVPAVDPLKYQKPDKPVEAAASDELLTLKLRYKAPDGDTTKLLTWPVKDSDQAFAQASSDYQFAAAVAAFGMLLRSSPHRGDATYAGAAEIAGSALGPDPYGYRRELVTLIKRAEQLAPPVERISRATE